MGLVLFGSYPVNFQTERPGLFVRQHESDAADIAGADDQYGTADDCQGGTNGFESAVFDESTGGTGLTTYCNADVLAATPLTKYAIVDFRQR